MDRSAPILGYANPLGGQPPGSRFEVDPLPAGVALRRALSADRLEAFAVVLVALFVLAGCGVCCGGVAFGRHHDWSNRMAAVLAAALLAAGVRLLGYARGVGRPRTQTIVLTGDRLVVTHAGWTVTGRPWSARRARAFGVVSDAQLIAPRRRCGVGARGRLGVMRSFISDLPRDECLWIAAVLAAALPADGARPERPDVAPRLTRR